MSAEPAARPTVGGAQADPLLRLFAPLLPPGTVARGAPIRPQAIDALFAEERAAIARAVPARQAEFASGRACARAALAALGLEAAAIPMAADRSPVWPTGVVGSITHDGGWCVAVAARAASLRGLGIDASTVEDFDPPIGRRICTPGEIDRLAQGRLDALRGADLAAIFSIKEAFYKAQHPITGQWLGFEDVDVELAPSADGAHRYALTLLRPAGSHPAGQHFTGRWASDGLRCVAVQAID